MTWENTRVVGRRKFVCGFCGKAVGPDRGYRFQSKVAKYQGWRIWICPTCDKPTFFTADEQIPAPLLGNDVSDVPEEVNSLYNEARACTGARAYTAAVLACRKLLMNIAVDKGAEEGKRFVEYVQYLADNHYVPPDGEIWVDHIRTKGNEATHEIALMSVEDAEELITFVEMLLRFIYEFPGRFQGT